MLRSLFAGVSGLINHQTKLDVIGNNISNINTIGYKSGRVNFQELLTQTIRGGSRAQDGVGGTNPIQIGLGMSVASVDTLHTQGNLQSTGNMYDFALQGEGFFVVSNGGQQYFTRAGAFGLDSMGHLVHQSSGGILQGYLPDADGVIRDSSQLQEILIDKSLIEPAQATSYINLAGNLKADSQALPTITESGRFMKLADTSAALMSLSQQEDGLDLNIREGDVISINGSVGGVAIVSSPSNMVVTETTTMQDLLDFIEQSIMAADPTYPPGSVSMTNGVINVAAHPAEDITGLRLIIGGNPDFNSAFTFPNTIPAGPINSGDMSQVLLQAADETDLIGNLYNQDGEPLDGPDSEYGIVDMTLSLQAYVGGEASTPTSFTVEGTSTLRDLMDALDTMLGITHIGTAGVTLSEDGEIRVEGNAGLPSEIESITITDAAAMISMGNTFQYTEVQGAKDSEMHPVSVDVYDSLGARHHLTLTFRKNPDSTVGTNQWIWEAAVDEPTVLRSGDRGTMVFNSSGELVSFGFDDGTGSVRIDPNNGAELLNFAVRTGSGASAVTQNAGASTAKVVASDGYTAGNLESTFVDESGTIVGQFSNGVNRVLAQIAVGRFANPSGLVRGGNNLFAENSNSGRPIVGIITGSTVNRITPGSLEMSNVDLAQEFTQMITAQRGFQANARIITTGDEMLQELVNLKR
jgi:flagellar hook protein FlgE